MASLQPGHSVDGKYTVLASLGSGGHARVYRVRHELLGQDRALKVLDLDANREDIRARFLQEARSIAMLDDPHVVKISDFGTLEDGRPFLILELIEGQTLADRIAAGPIPVPESIDWAIQILEGLALAHDHGIVHRDLKPQNIMLHEGQVKILDFGLAHVAAFGAEDEDQIFGTPSYMAPEQATGEAVDGRADLYAVGLVLHEMLTGRTVFSGQSPLAILQRQIAEMPPSLPDGLAEPWRASALQAALDKSLQKEPDERHENAPAMIRALWPLRPRADEGERQRRVEESLAEFEATQTLPRQRTWALTGGALLLLVAAALGLFVALG